MIPDMAVCTLVPSISAFALKRFSDTARLDEFFDHMGIVVLQISKWGYAM